MKKIICFLLLLTLAAGVHAGDKKKKKSGQSGGSPISMPGGGGGGSGSHKGGGLSGVPHMGQSTGHSRTPRSSTGSVPKMSSHAPTRGQGANPSASGAGKTSASPGSSNPLMRKGGQAGAKGSASNPLSRKSDPNGAQTSASNPLARKGGQAGGGDQGTNPLRRSDRPDKAGGQAANPMDRGGRQAGAKTGPIGRKGDAQADMGGRNRDAMANRNNSRAAHNRGAQAGRGYANRTGARNWQHGNHANYRVRSSREVFHNYRPARHDRGWYTSRYDRVVVVGGGYYYWDAGYWYPAWGYDPAFSLYVYDGPIYSYNNLPPDQVTMDVQTALQDDGYYTGEIDGLVGPKTRDALGAYQTDHDLEVTSAIDEPTVESLGLAQS